MQLMEKKDLLGQKCILYQKILQFLISKNK